MEKMIEMTPLVEAFLDNPTLVADLGTLHAKVELLFHDCGDDLDAMMMLRDTTVYLVAKMREERTNNPNYAAENREFAEEKKDK